MTALAFFMKNEEHCLEHMLGSVIEWVEEIVAVDTGSTDRSIEIARDFGARVYQVGFTDFGKIRTLTGHLVRSEWILMLDCDESLSNPHLLAGLIRQNKAEAYGLPRKRWLDLEMTQQTEVEAYPDWQVRLYRNRPDYVWRRELHEYFDGAEVHNMNCGITINHFQDVFKDAERNRIRYKLYQELSKKAKVSIDGGKPIEKEESNECMHLPDII